MHVVHLSSQVSLPLLIAARTETPGLITVETCPHYLCFSAEEIPDGATWFKCCPPIRDSANRNQLWRALIDGHIDMVGLVLEVMIILRSLCHCVIADAFGRQIVSDHSPSSPGQKCLESGDFKRAWGGIAGVQFRLLAVWTAAHARGIALAKLCQWMSEAPARLLRIDDRKGRIAPGFDGDFVVWDPDQPSTVQTVHHLHDLTPYKTMAFRGTVHATYRLGRAVYINDLKHGEMFEPTASGRVLIRRCDAIEDAEVILN